MGERKTQLIQPVEGSRARYRKQVRDEVQELAWEQISQAGASALSLKSIAAQMGMTAPALYRYYTSRDELLTQLILATYQELAEVVEDAVDKASAASSLAQIAQALRRWAVANPQRYLLLYGTPVPGYEAPDEATDLARRIFAPIVAGFAALLGDTTAADSPSPGYQRSLLFWTRLHGVLSLELAGHLTGMDVDTDALFAAEVETLIHS